MREVTEQGHDVGERLVERGHVRIRLLHEVASDAVDDRVGHLVHDDVMRQARVDDLAGQVVSLILFGLESTRTGFREPCGL